MSGPTGLFNAAEENKGPAVENVNGRSGASTSSENNINAIEEIPESNLSENWFFFFQLTRQFSNSQNLKKLT